MRSLLIYACLLVLFLSGCGGSDPVGTPGLSGNPEADREATALFGGRVTLNGRVITSPSYKNAPYTTSFTGVAGEVALITLTAKGVPNASTKSVLVRISGTSSYGSYQVKRDGIGNRIPILLSKTEPIQLVFYNSNGITLYPEAVEWSWSIRTRNPLDGDETNDDGNLNTITDRALAKVLPANASTSYTLMQRTGVYDLEDWYRIDLPSGGSSRISIPTGYQGWGSWDLDLYLYSAAGVQLWHSESRSINHTGDGGPFYVRVTGLPIGAPKGNLHFCQYSLVTELPPPPPAWREHVIAAAPAFPDASAIHFGRPMVTYSDGTNLNFAYASRTVPRGPEDWAIHSISNIAAPGQVMSFSGRVVIPGDFLFISKISFPTKSSDWAAHPWPELAFRRLMDVGGRMAVIGRNAANGTTYGQAASTFPTGLADWTTHQFWETWIGSQVAAVNGHAAVVDTYTIPEELGRYLRFTRATVPGPVSAEQWASHDLDSISTEEGWFGYNPLVVELDAKHLVVGSRTERWWSVQQEDWIEDTNIKVWQSEIAAPMGGQDWQLLNSIEVSNEKLTLTFGRPIKHRDGYAMLYGFDSLPLQLFTFTGSEPKQHQLAVTTGASIRDRLMSLNGGLAVVSSTPAGLTFAYETTGW